MSGWGFVHEKLDIKFLILYVMARVTEPVPFEDVLELSMCDDGFGYFDFSDCLAELVSTEHVLLQDGLYTITEKGERNSAICETSLPYSVRMQVEQDIIPINEQLKRRSLVGAMVEPREQGGFEVKLSISDELDELMDLRLLVTRQDMAKEIQKNFKAHAEEIYTKILAALYSGQ